MSINRYFIDSLLNPGTSVLLDNDEFHHLKVLRAKAGEEIELVNGCGALASARIERLDKNAAHLKVIDCTEQPRPDASVSLCMGLIRSSRLEWAVEKATELGVDTLFLFQADLSEKLSLSTHQIKRLRHLAISALKQCNRLYLPEILLVSLEEVLSKKDVTILYGDMKEHAPWIGRLDHSVLFVSGPEKGFSDRELRLLQSKGQGVKLSHNILRAETAPLAALSILLCEKTYTNRNK